MTAPGEAVIRKLVLVRPAQLNGELAVSQLSLLGYRTLSHLDNRLFSAGHQPQMILCGPARQAELTASYLARQQQRLTGHPVPVRTTPLLVSSGPAGVFGLLTLVADLPELLGSIQEAAAITTVLCVASQPLLERFLEVYDVPLQLGAGGALCISQQAPWPGFAVRPRCTYSAELFPPVR